jgi:hypothetical protein
MGVIEDLKTKISELKQKETEAKKCYDVIKAELTKNQRAVDILEGRSSKRKYAKRASATDKA